MEENKMTKAQQLAAELKRKKQSQVSDKPNPLELLKRKKQEDSKTQIQINKDAKDPAKAILIDIDKIIPLIANGEVMHNRSGMSTKDQDELKKFAESLKLTKEGTLYKTGLIQAITVRPSKTKEGYYELIAGYRRTEAFKLNGSKQIPAIIVEVDDKTARRLRNNENKQRRALNAYDETYGDLEEIQLYCDFLTLEETKKKINRAANVIKKENALVKILDKNHSSAEYEKIINEKSNYSLEEHTFSKELEQAIKSITQKTLSTFCKRLEILNISEDIKKYLLNIDDVLPKPISYSEALSLKKVAKDDTELINKAVQWLESKEKEDKKRPSASNFEKWLKNEAGYENKNRGNNRSREREEFINTIEKLNNFDIDNLPNDKKEKALQLLREFSDSIENLNSN